MNIFLKLANNNIIQMYVKHTERSINMKALDYTVLTIILIGAINWGLIGFFDFDLVSTIFGQMTMLTRIIYALVGIGGLYAISYYGRMQPEI